MKSTKKSFIGALFALVICFTMLVGSTLAWFTDSASVGIQTITTGELDVAIQDKDGNSLEGQILTWQKKNANVGDPVWWEPGATYETNEFYIVNDGNLGLKFKIALGELTGDVDLADVLTFDVIADASQFSFNINSIAYTASGEFDLLEGANIDTIFYGIHYFDEYTVAPSTKIGPLKVVAHMAESAGNEYMNKTLSGIGLNILAAQATGDEDSYNGTYDAFASYAGVAYEIPAMNKTANTTLGEDFVIEHENGSVIIEGTANHTTVNATVTESDPKVQIVSEGNKIASYDIKVDGYAGDVTVSLFLGYNFGDIAVYHEGAPMDSADYSYNPETGYITFVTDSFSVFDIEYCAEKFVPVASYDELLAQITAGNNAVLTQDLHCSATSGNAVGYIGSESFVIDLNGYKMTTDTDNSIFRLRNEGTEANEISIINGTLETDDSTYCTVIATGVTAPMTVNLDNMSIYSNKTWSQTVKAFDGSIINITNCYFNNKNGGGVVACGGTVNVLGDDNVFVQAPTGDTPWNANNVSVSNGGELNVYGGKFTSSYYAFAVLSTGGTINIYDGDFASSFDHVGDVGNNIWESGLSSSSVLNIYGGKFDNLNTEADNDGVINCWDLGTTNEYVTIVNAYADNASYGSIHNQYDSIINEYKKVSSSTDVSNAITSGQTAILNQDISYGTSFGENNANVDLNEKTFEATTTINANANVSISNGNYEVNNTYGHIDARNEDTSKPTVLTFEDVNFSFNKLNYTYGTSTDRLGSILEVCPAVAGAETRVYFKNCTFDNAQVVLEGMSGKTGKAIVVFENCTFNALTSSAPIYVQNYIEIDVTIKDCTFNMEVTSGTASAVSISPSSSTSGKVTFDGTNTFNSKVATKTDDSLAGTIYQVKVNGNPSSTKLISYYSNVTVANNGTVVVTGIAQNNIA